MKSRKDFVTLVSIILVFLKGSLFAQGLAPQLNNASTLYVKGQLIAKIADNNDIVKIKKANNVQNVSLLAQGIYTIHFDNTSLNEDKMMANLREQFGTKISVIQKNHYTQLRSLLPNDPEIVNQSFFDLVHAFKAWEKAIGGTTRSGDTIVLAMIDDGLDTSHIDIQNNIWRNRGEIPHDGIDNDGNGYTDDYYGWNSYTNSPNIVDNDEKAIHGTSVAGILGADGNNGIGISGANWNVKIMTVLGGSRTEADNIIAFDYVLQQKKRYLSSNGAQGAYVVALNCSWGVSGVYPSSAPLWCAFFDTLGKYGISTFGATANQAINISDIGDLPTMCPSEHLIMVTNVNAGTDRRSSNAAYDAVHVDIAAPGEGSYSLCAKAHQASNGNLYKSFSGTSGAAPIVAGLTGLIYNYACSNFTTLAKNDPKAASLLANKWILDGIDSNQTLKNITVTGGRVNYYKTLVEVEKWCTLQGQNISSNLPFVQQAATILPNPNNGNFTISVNEMQSIKNIQCISVTGQLLYQWQNTNAQQISTVKLSNLNIFNANGLILCNILLEDGTVLKTKVMIY